MNLRIDPAALLGGWPWTFPPPARVLSWNTPSTRDWIVGIGIGRVNADRSFNFFAQPARIRDVVRFKRDEPGASM